MMREYSTFRAVDVCGVTSEEDTLFDVECGRNALPDSINCEPVDFVPGEGVRMEHFVNDGDHIIQRWRPLGVHLAIKSKAVLSFDDLAGYGHNRAVRAGDNPTPWIRDLSCRCI